MANLTEVSQWENVIRQIENGEAATGGADGLANVQAKQLANRTKWLKENYLPRNLGEYSPGNGLYTSNNTSNLLIAGGKTWDEGAHLQIFGKDCKYNKLDNSEGCYVLSANDGINISRLVAFANGLLRWNEDNIVRSVNNEKAGIDGNVSLGIGIESAIAMNNNVLTFSDTKGLFIVYSSGDDKFHYSIFVVNNGVIKYLTDDKAHFSVSLDSGVVSVIGEWYTKVIRLY